ncbi:MAG TPA: hypothetical protein PKK43_13570, partial [Spirochaetota bacterium]|nr:hypothetical protein [Spirochaetota bacterium]
PVHLMWMDDNSVAAVESKGSDLVVVSVPEGNVSRVKLTESKIRDFVVRDDRRFIACDLFDECMKIYDLRDDKTLCDVAIPSKGTAYQWDGDHLYVGTDNGTLHRFTVSSTESLIERLDAESEQAAGLQS